MRRGLYFVGVAVGLIAFLERHAYAEPEELACTMSSAAVVDKRNQVALHLDERLPANLRTQLSKQLRAVLLERKLVLCTEQPSGGSSSGALAKIVLTIEESTSSSDAIVATMTVRDEVTSKRVARDVDLRGIPDDGRALVLTQVADELLRASWAELLLVDAPKPKEPLPDEVKRSIEPAQNPDRLPASNARPLIAIDAGLGGEIFGVGQKQLGADISVLVTPTKYVGALLQGGVRSGARTETTAGVIDASAIIGSAAIVLSPFSDPSRKFGVDAGPEIFLTRAHYESRGPAETKKDDGTAAHASLVGHGWIGIVGPLRVSATLRAGAPLHPVRIVAANEKVSGVGGILLGGQLSVGMGW